MLKQGRYAASAAFWRNRIVVCGGYDNNATSDPPPRKTCEMLALPRGTKWEMTGDLPTNSAAGCMLTINETVECIEQAEKGTLFSYFTSAASRARTLTKQCRLGMCSRITNTSGRSGRPRLTQSLAHVLALLKRGEWQRTHRTRLCKVSKVRCHSQYRRTLTASEV